LMAEECVGAAMVMSLLTAMNAYLGLGARTLSLLRRGTSVVAGVLRGGAVVAACVAMIAVVGTLCTGGGHLGIW
jgi:hypothetical protein